MLDNLKNGAIGFVSAVFLCGIAAWHFWPAPVKPLPLTPPPAIIAAAVQSQACVIVKKIVKAPDGTQTEEDTLSATAASDVQVHEDSPAPAAAAPVYNSSAYADIGLATNGHWKGMVGASHEGWNITGTTDGNKDHAAFIGKTWLFDLNF